MPRTVRFHLDEHVNPAIAEGLRRQGIDVTTTAETGLYGAADEAHAAFALAEGRVIFTHDEDFLALKSRGVDHRGIAYCHQHSLSIGDIIRGLILIWEVLDPEDMGNRIEFL